MDFVKYTILAMIWNIAQSQRCTLDRNTYNTHPYMVKMVVDGQMLCQGALVSPWHVVSAFNPFESIKQTFKTKLTFVADVYGPDGKIKCSAKRKANIKTAPVSVYLDVSYWSTTERFDVTDNHPYIFSRSEDIVRFKTRNLLTDFQKSGVSEPCVLPVYSSRSLQATIEVHILKFITRDKVAYWRNVHCHGSKTCMDEAKKYKFFMYEVEGQAEMWHAGAVLYCWGTAVGTMSNITDDQPAKSTGTIGTTPGNASIEAPAIQPEEQNGNERRKRTLPKRAIVFESLENSMTHFRKFTEQLHWSTTTAVVELKAVAPTTEGMTVLAEYDDTTVLSEPRSLRSGSAVVNAQWTTIQAAAAAAVAAMCTIYQAMREC